jgi:hypothetical protein
VFVAVWRVLGSYELAEYYARRSESVYVKF